MQGSDQNSFSFQRALITFLHYYLSKRQDKYVDQEKIKPNLREKNLTAEITRRTSFAVYQHLKPEFKKMILLLIICTHWKGKCYTENKL